MCNPSGVGKSKSMSGFYNLLPLRGIFGLRNLVPFLLILVPSLFPVPYFLFPILFLFFPYAFTMVWLWFPYEITIILLWFSYDSLMTLVTLSYLCLRFFVAWSGSCQYLISHLSYQFTYFFLSPPSSPTRSATADREAPQGDNSSSNKKGRGLAQPILSP